MTEDKLRKECEEVLEKFRCYVPGAWQLRTEEDLEALKTLKDGDVSAMVVFAQRMIAVGLREAVGICRARAKFYADTREVHPLGRGMQVNEADGCGSAIEQAAKERKG